MSPHARLQSVDALKGAAIPGVVFAHMMFSSRFDGDALRHVALLQTLTGWCVLAFFLASGILHARADAGRGWLDFAKRRALRLLVPCALFTWGIKLLLLALKGTGLAISAAQIPQDGPADVAAFLLVPAAPQFYFLAHLFAVAVAVHALLKLRLFAHPLAPWLLAGALMQAYWFLPLDKPHGEALTQPPLYAALYLAGLGLTPALGKSGAFSRMVAGPVIFTAAVAAAGTARPQALHAIVPAALLMLLAIPPARSLAPLAWLGRKSGVIFAWHTPFLMPALSLLLAKTPLTGWALVAAMTVLAITGSLLIGRLVALVDRRGLLRL